jgi:hypothetical protein
VIHAAALPLAVVSTGAALRVPVDIDRDEARAAARRELADPAYQAAEPSLLQRVMTWIFEMFGELLGAVAGAMPGGIAGLLVMAAIAVAIAVIVRLRMGKLARSARGDKGPVFEGRTRTAAEHRRAAEEALARGELADAVRERFRAVVRDLEQRGLLDEHPGRTADEAAAEGGAQLPGSAAGLRESARIFDDVWYGGRPANREAYDRVAAVDVRVQAERPARVGAGR